MKRFIIFFGLLVLFFPFKTKAIFCTNDKKVGYQTSARNITTSYTYTEDNGNISFQIKLSNIPKNFIVKDIKNKNTYNYQGSEITINNLKPDTSYRFDIYVGDLDCDNELMYSHYVNTPAYNPYYQDEVCIGMESYSICQKWFKVTMSIEEFRQKVNQLKEPEKPIIERPIEKTKGFTDYMLDFYLNYYYIILPIFILSGFIIIYYYNKKNDLF